MDKEAFFEDVEFFSELDPLIVKCEDDRWKELLGDYALVDAATIGRTQLFGTDYVRRTFFKPDWLLKAEETKRLVLINLDKVPIRPENDNDMRQYDFSFFFRSEEYEHAYRELNFGSGIFLPDGLKVIVILKHHFFIDPYFMGICSVIDIDDY